MVVGAGVSGEKKTSVYDIGRIFMKSNQCRKQLLVKNPRIEGRYIEYYIMKRKIIEAKTRFFC